MREFQPARTMRELWRDLDNPEYVDGYKAAEAGAPEPINCTRSFWHGWMLGAVDAGIIPLPEDMKPVTTDRLLRYERCPRWQ